MAYMNVKEVSKLWPMIERRITMLCQGGRILGARKEGKSWMIPDIAELPVGGRTKKRKR